MTKVTYHLKNGKTVVDPDDGMSAKGSAQAMSRYIAAPDAAVIVPGEVGKALVVPSRSVDYIELG